MLLDEPFSSLDAGLRWQLRSDVRRLLKGIGVTTILVTHDQDEALTFGDRVAVMRAGTIEQVGSPSEVYGRPASPWVATFVGEANLLAARFGDDGADTAIGRAADQPSTSGRGQVLCRPEQLRLDAVRPGDGQRRQLLRPGHSLRGRRSRRRAGHRARAGPPEHEPGDAVTVRFAAATAHGWPAVALGRAYLICRRTP